MKITKCPFCESELKNVLYGHPKFYKYLAMMARVFSLKNQDYADDIDPFKNFRLSEGLGIPPWKGALIRLGDKFIRINNIASNGKAAVKNETILDTLIDLANYAIIARILYEERK